MKRMGLVPVAALLLSAGCAPLEPPPETDADDLERARLWETHRRSVADLDEWGFRGRFGLRWEGGQVQGRLQWRQMGAGFQLRLSGPFGLNPVRIAGDLRTGEAVLDDGEKVARGMIEEVMRARLGFALPLAELADLARGIPSSDSGEVTLDGQARALRILQGGWEIDYRDYSCCEEPALPGRVRFAQESMRGALVVREWSRN